MLLQMLGYTREELEAGCVDWFALTPEEWRAADAAGMVQVRERGRHEPFEKEFFRRDGTRVPVLLGSSLYPDSDSEGVSFALDMSGRKAEERGMLEHTVQQRVAGVLESITDAFVALDAEWRITYMNAEAERLAGQHRNDFIGRSHWEVWPASVGTEVERQYRRVAEERVPSHFENLYDDGETRAWFEVRASPAAGSDGGINVFYRNITTQKEAAQKQRRFLREMLWGLTEGRLRLCDTAEDLPEELTPAAPAVELTAGTLRQSRRQVEGAANDLGFASERTHDLLTASGEAAKNAVRHAGGGVARVHTDPAAGVIQVWVRDTGRGSPRTASTAR
jgi:PAS domain S-box-containing protein